MFTDKMRFLDVLSAADGPNMKADLKNVRVTHRNGGNEKVSKLDLALYFETGDENLLPEVKDGDTIFIPNKDDSTVAKIREGLRGCLSTANNSISIIGSLMHIQKTIVEIERIHSLLSEQNIRSIAITSSNSGEGVTSIAMALAQHSLLGGYSTLLIDLNMYRPSIKTALKLDDDTLKPSLFNAPDLVCLEDTSIVVTGITAPTERATAMKIRQHGVFETIYIKNGKNLLIELLLTPRLSNRVNANNIPAERVAAACDGCLIVVLAGSTTESMIISATDKLKNTSARIIGTVFNDRDNPNLKNQLLSAIKRLSPRFKSQAKRLEVWVRNNRFLDLEI